MVSGRGGQQPGRDPEWLEFRSPDGGDGRPARRRLVVIGVVVVLVLVGWNTVRSSDDPASTPQPGPSSAGSAPQALSSASAWAPPPRRTLPPGSPMSDDHPLYAVSADPTSSSASATSTAAADPSASATSTVADQPTGSADLPTARRTPLAGPTVLPGGRPLLSGAGDWQLFVRGNADLYGIQVGTGRTVHTELPPLRLTGEFSFVAGPHDVVVAPRDSGTGVLVPDGRPARALPGVLARPGSVFPAGQGRLWYQSSSDVGLGATEAAPVLLTGFDGRASGTSIPVRTGYLTSDGLGNLLLKDGGGVDELDGTAVRRVTAGSVSAVGPHHYLVLDCDAVHQCSTYLYDRSTRQQRRIGSADSGGIASGLIAPDGDHVALIHWDRAGPPHFVILDLRDGTEQQLAGSPDPSLSGIQGNAVWSPDGHWLFALVNGRITIVDVRTGTVVTPELALPALRQITLRTPTAGSAGSAMPGTAAVR